MNTQNQKTPIQSEALYKALVQACPDAVVVTDLNGSIIEVSDRAVEIHRGACKEDLIGKSALDLMCEEEQPRAAENLKKTLTCGYIENTEYKLVRKDGTTFIGEISASVVKDIEGNPMAFIATTRDITERRKAEQALQVSEEKYRWLFNSAADPIFVVEIKEDGTPGKFLDVNETGCKKIGFTLEELQNMTPEELDDMENFEAKQKYLLDILTKGYSIIETNISTREGNKIPIELNSHLLTLGSKKFILSVARDLTDRKRAEEALRAADKIDSLGIIAAGIAHDFNNVLTGIIGNLSMAVNESKKGSSFSSRIQKALDAAFRAKNITRQLLTFSKGGAPVKKTCYVGKLVKDTAELVLSGSNVLSKFIESKDTWPVDIDEGQISQVVSNIVINASQSMPKGGLVRIEVANAHIEEDQIKDFPSGNYVRIAIEDSGVGISSENLSKIFDPYFSTKSGGSGLGLASSLSIVKRHRGHISVDSKVAAGSTFTVYLPASEKAPELEEIVQVSLPPGKKRILVMDDDKGIRFVLSDMIKSFGYEAVEASSGEQAIALAVQSYRNKEPIDAAILDLTIPGGLGGKEAFAELKKIAPSIKGIISSGYSDTDIISDSKQYGFSGVLIKPYRVEDLCETLKTVFADK